MASTSQPSVGVVATRHFLADDSRDCVPETDAMAVGVGVVTEVQEVEPGDIPDADTEAPHEDGADEDAAAVDASAAHDDIEEPHVADFQDLNSRDLSMAVAAQPVLPSAASVKRELPGHSLLSLTGSPNSNSGFLNFR
jgi:hypothetical protein